MMCGRGMPSSSTSSSSLATTVVVSGIGWAFWFALDLSDGLWRLSRDDGWGTLSVGVNEDVVMAAEVDNTGEEVVELVLVNALGILRGICTEGAGNGVFRCENGPEEAADDIGMGCSLSMLIRAAFPVALPGL